MINVSATCKFDVNDILNDSILLRVEWANQSVGYKARRLANAQHKVGVAHRKCQEKYVVLYFYVEHRGKALLLCIYLDHVAKATHLSHWKLFPRNQVAFFVSPSCSE